MAESRPADRGEKIDAAPTWRHVARLAVWLALFVALAACGYALRWWVPAAVFTVLAAAFAAVCWLLGGVMVRIALRPLARPGHAGATSREALLGALAGAVFGGPGSSEGAEGVAGQARADLAVRGIDPDAPEERAADRAVGPMLALLPPMEAEFGACLSEGRRAELRALRLEERAATYAWLQGRGPWQDARVTAQEGVELAGRVMVAVEGGDCWAVLAHGYRGSWREVIQYARRWSEMGYNLLLVEERAHGASGGDLVGMGYLERRDLVAWCRWLEGERGAGQVVLHGHSMGGAAVCLAAGEADLPSCVRAVVADCAFSNAWGAFTGMLAASTMPVHPTVDLMRLRLKLARGGYDLADADPRRALARPGVPVLLFHGDDDPAVPPAMAGELLEAAREGGRRAELVRVPGAGHCQCALAEGDAYFARIAAFVALCG